MPKERTHGLMRPLGILTCGVLLSACGSSASPNYATDLVMSLCPGGGCTSVAPADLPAAQSETVAILQARATTAGASAEITATGSASVEVKTSLPTTSALALFGVTGRLSFASAVFGPADPRNAQFLRDQGSRYDMTQLDDPLWYPPGYHWMFDRVLSGRNITSATTGVDQNGQPAVEIAFDDGGAAEWSILTTRVAQQPAGSPGNRVAIFLDNQVLTAPQVIAASSRSTQISGGFTVASAATLAAQINAGALPADIYIISVNGTSYSPSPSAPFIAPTPTAVLPTYAGVPPTIPTPLPQSSPVH